MKDNSINAFANTVVDALKNLLGDDYEIKTETVMKNNSKECFGLSIRSRDSFISPIIYLDHFYQEYLEDEDIDQITDEILSFFQSHNAFPTEFDMNSFLNWNQAKDRIECKVISQSKNRELLETTPFIPFLDLAIVFLYAGHDGISPTSSYNILIRNSHLSTWGVTVDDLEQVAVESQAQIKSMQELLGEMLGNPPEDTATFPVYVMNSANTTFGATTILCFDTLDDFANRLESDLVIIPSSIYELILIPTDKDIDTNTIREMIVDVNATAVSEEDILSDHPYIYSREKKAVIAA